MSWNCGAEGPTDDAEINAFRARQKRNFLATLFLSQGVPMLQAGDEIERTQWGNNNAYCQDNEISWLDWELDESKREMLRFTRHLIKLFKEHPVLRRRKFFQGRRIRGSEVKDLSWFRPDGEEMAEDDWHSGAARCLGVRLAGDAIDEVDERGNRVVDDTLLIILNAHHEPVSFTLPAHRADVRWTLLLDTGRPSSTRRAHPLANNEPYLLDLHSLALFCLQDELDHGEPETAKAAARKKRLKARSD